MIIDGWNYDFTDAPRSLDDEIIVVLKDREKAWTTHCWGEGGVAVVFWDAGVYDGVRISENVGWTTGGCQRFPDDEFECWRPLPPKRARST